MGISVRKKIPMKQIQTVRMAEIAQSLGVTASTVSRALRDDPRIGAETRQRVKQAAEKHGYRPNPLVSALMASRRRPGGSGAIDVIALVTDYGREDWRKKDVCRWEYEGIQRRATALGFRVEVFPLAEYRNDMTRLAATLRARGIRGVLLGFSRETASRGTFDVSGFAVAGLSTYFPEALVDRANFHGFYNVQLALARIAALGYKRPALVTPALNNQVSNNLWSGAFLDWQRRLPKRDRCEPFIPREDAEATEFSDWLYRNEPDALLVYKVPIRAWLNRRGARVPEDVGLAWLYRTSDEMNGTAGIDGNLDIVGAAALDLVVERLNANNLGPTEHPKEVLITGTWRDGQTMPSRFTPPPKKAAEPRRKKASSPALR